MSEFRGCHGLILAAGLFLVSVAARADLYGAEAALAKQDLPRAFELYRELAEMGDLRGQENLAAMYVGGEGVKRDNVLGYAWAVIAKENGGGEAAQSIVSQLEPHVTATARLKVAELQKQFGKAAIEKRWLPATPVSLLKVGGCNFRKIPNPANFFPVEAKKRGFSGKIMVGFTVDAAGYPHNPRVWFATPRDLFDDAARALVMASTFDPKQQNGAAVPCSMRIMVKFVNPGGGEGDADIRKSFNEVKPKALAGDPVSQAIYGILLATRPDLNASDESFMPWLTRAAQAGVPAAQFMVGMSVFDGFAAEVDEAKGLAWLNKAADAGNGDAQVSLANYLMRIRGAGGDAVQALHWLEKASASGTRDGKYELAAMLAAHPDAAIRDPKRALTAVAELDPEHDALPTALEIRAAAHAFMGDFGAALLDQRQALRKARTLGWNLEPLKARIADYEAQKTWAGDLLAR
ncbi:MAG: TonB family protein [Pseudomonadota bacterium]